MCSLRQIEKCKFIKRWKFRSNIFLHILVSTSLILPRLSLTESKSDACCFSGNNICTCPRLTLNQLPTTPCDQKIPSRDLIQNPISVYLEQPVIPGLYTILAVAPDVTRRYNRFDMVWVVFMAINVPDSCLSTNVPPCVIQPIYRPRVLNCSHLLDKEYRIFVFSVKQQREFQLNEFLGETAARNINRTGAFGHFMDNQRLHNPIIFNKSPTHANRYQVTRCNPTLMLYTMSQIVEQLDEFPVIEEFFYSPSPTYPLYYKLRNRFPFALITENMIRWERRTCGMQREIKGSPVVDSILPRPAHCKEAYVRKFMAGLRRDSSKLLMFQKKWKNRLNIWVKHLSYQSHLIYWLRVISSKKRASDKFLLIRRHTVSEPFAKAYWTSLHKGARIVCKLQIFGELLRNSTGKWPDYD